MNGNANHLKDGKIWHYMQGKMAEKKEQENFELDKSFQELNSDGGLSYTFFSLLKLKFADRPLSVVTEPICK